MLRYGKHHCGGRAFGLITILVLTLFLLAGSHAGIAYTNKFERTYTPEGPAHLTISNVNGDVTVTAWNKRTVNVRADVSPSVSINDHALGDEITVAVKRKLLPGRADFEVFVPADTSVSIKNMMGRIEVHNVTGHVSVDSYDSDVRLVGVRSPSVDVKVTTGDLFFDGELRGSGTYSLQCMKGNIDVSLPAETPFTLVARSLNENINLGDFLSGLMGTGRGAKGITGTHLRGGPRLNLTTYAGRILLHKK
jgi:DUF4097 and DUF4098 domain-containing protein YvlB